MPDRTARTKQHRLFCPCGTRPPAVAGLCRPCYRQLLHSRAHFGGQRHLVLERDHQTCRVCGTPNQRTVHHRRPGKNAPELLADHHLSGLPCPHSSLSRPPPHVPPALVPFWAEQHPHTALQLQLDFGQGANG